MTGFVAVSSAIAETLRSSLAIPANKIGVFPNGVDLSLFRPRDRLVARREFSLPEGPVYVSFVGAFDELKGIARLADAVSALPNVKLLLAGKGTVPFDRTKVAFAGVIDHHRIPDLLAASDMFVLPTCEEGSCNAVIEAMACGLPVVTSNGRYMDDLLLDEPAVRVDPFNVLGLREAIARIARDHELRQRMSVASLQQSRLFDINQRASRIVAWLQEAAGNERANTRRRLCDHAVAANHGA